MDTANASLNKWELEASQRPLASGEAIVGMIALGAFGILFAAIFAISVYAIVGPKQQGGLADQYQEKLGGGEATPAAPAAP